jgi:hypothetical protein
MCFENDEFEISFADMLAMIFAPPQPLPPMMRELLAMSERAEQPDGTRKYPIDLNFRDPANGSG